MHLTERSLAEELEWVWRSAAQPWEAGSYKDAAAASSLEKRLATASATSATSCLETL